MLEKFKQIINNIRINLIYFFYPSYIIKSHSRRKGQCKKCGQCCKRCLYLTEDNSCSVYHNRPRWCAVDFPIDNLDIKLREIKNCGYYWKNGNKPV